MLDHDGTFAQVSNFKQNLRYVNLFKNEPITFLVARMTGNAESVINKNHGHFLVEAALWVIYKTYCIYSGKYSL